MLSALCLKHPADVKACLKGMIDYGLSMMGQQIAQCEWDWVKPMMQLQRQKEREIEVSVE